MTTTTTPYDYNNNLCYKNNNTWQHQETFNNNNALFESNANATNNDDINMKEWRVENRTKKEKNKAQFENIKSTLKRDAI